MNELNITTDFRTPIEVALDVDKDGMTTARKLYKFLELATSQFSRWCKTNIVDNEFAEENVDYWGFDIDVEGNKTVDYKLTAHFAKKLSTRGSSAKAEEAREYFATVEEKIKAVAINVSQLSPELQVLSKMVESMARKELEDKERDRKIEEVKQIAGKAIESVDNIKEAVKPVLDDWRHNIKLKIDRISNSSGIEWGQVNNGMYKELEQRAGCDLGRRLRNRQKKMYDRGCTKTAIGNIRKIDIIEEDKELKEIFTKIVSEWEVKYCV